MEEEIDSGNQIEKIAEQATCFACGLQYRNPKVLACLHSFCCECIRSVVDSNANNTITCPLCKSTSTVLPPEGVEGLLSNVFLDQLLQTLLISTEAPPKCEACDPEESPDEATAQCADCPLFLCDFHIQSHKKTKETKNHRLVTMEGTVINAGILTKLLSQKFDVMGQLQPRKLKHVTSTQMRKLNCGVNLVRNQFVEIAPLAVIGTINTYS